jgi:hypothetical protein
MSGIHVVMSAADGGKDIDIQHGHNDGDKKKHSIQIDPYHITKIVVYHTANHKYAEENNATNSSFSEEEYNATNNSNAVLPFSTSCGNSPFGKGWCASGIAIYRSDGYVLDVHGKYHVDKTLTYSVQTPDQFVGFQGDEGKYIDYIEPVTFKGRVSGKTNLGWESFTCSGAPCSEEVSYGVSHTDSKSSDESAKLGLSISSKEGCLFENVKVSVSTAFQWSQTIQHADTSSASTTKKVTCGSSNSSIVSWNIWQFFASADPFGTGGTVKFKNDQALLCFPYNQPKPKCLPGCCEKLPPDGYCQTCRNDKDCQ